MPVSSTPTFTPSPDVSPLSTAHALSAPMNCGLASVSGFSSEFLCTESTPSTASRSRTLLPGTRMETPPYAIRKDRSIWASGTLVRMALTTWLSTRPIWRV
jgi:hypothetical protein